MAVTPDELSRSFHAGTDPAPVDEADVRLQVDPALLVQLTKAVEEREYVAAEAIVRDNWFDVLMGLRYGFGDVLARIPPPALFDRPLLLMMLGTAYNLVPQRRARGLRYFAAAARAARPEANSRRGISGVDRALILSSECAAYRLIGLPKLGLRAAAKAVEALDGLPDSERAGVQALSRVYAHIGTTQFYADEVDAALETFEKGMAEQSALLYSDGFANLAMSAGIHAFQGDIYEAEAHIELVMSGDWTLMQRSWYPGTFYRLSEAIVALESFNHLVAETHIAAMVHDRRTIEHWVAIAATEALTNLVAGRPAAALAGLNAFVTLRGAEGRKSASRAKLAPIRALLHLALGDPGAAAGALRLPAVNEIAHHIGRARIELSLGRPGGALSELRNIDGEDKTAREEAETLALEAAALLSLGKKRKHHGVLTQLGEHLNRTGQRLAVAFVPGESYGQLRDHLARAGFDDLVRGLPERSLINSFITHEKLSAREIAVLSACMKASTIKGVAEELSVSVNTVKSQLRNIYRKLEVSSRDEAIAVAIDRHLLEPRE